MKVLATMHCERASCDHFEKCSAIEKTVRHGGMFPSIWVDRDVSSMATFGNVITPRGIDMLGHLYDHQEFGPCPVVNTDALWPTDRVMICMRHAMPEAKIDWMASLPVEAYAGLVWEEDSDGQHDAQTHDQG